MSWRRAGLAGGLLALGALGYLSWSHKPGASAGWTLQGNALQGALGETVTFARATGTAAIQQSAVYLGSLALADGGATNQAQGWLSNVVLIPQGTPQ